jgi:hypothetical protein
VKEGEDYLHSINESNVTATKMTWELFQVQPQIVTWKTAMDRRMVSQPKQRAWMRSFFTLCRHLNRMPGRITLEECAKVVVEQRNRYYANEPQIKSIAYSSIRESVRGFFMSVRDTSAMTLTNLGVGKEELKGSGKYARQKVPQDVRHSFEKLCVGYMEDRGDIGFYEALGNSQFNFSTGSRISASLRFNFDEHQHNLQKNKWMFEIWDKGSRGKRLRWEKIMMGKLLNTFKGYCSKRFAIPIDKLEVELPKVTDSLYPSFVKKLNQVNDDKMRDLVKPLLIEAGIPYKDFPPTHIWRHTFAQEALLATDYNYELVASLGGWVNTSILKKHYGQMSEAARERGLLRAMGEPVPDVTYELEW